MDIDFNNVRRQAVNNYNSLVKKLNVATTSSGGAGSHWIEMSPMEIKEDLDNLRSTLAGIACTYEEGEPKFKDVLKEGEQLEIYHG